jgi:hypothetical protein
VQVGVVILPEHRWADARAIWRRAEELGFGHAWTYDHLAWRSLRDAPWFGAVPTLTAAALASQRIRLGTLVASPNFRHPVWVTTGDRTAAAPIPAEAGAQVVRAQIDRLDEACVELGRDPSTLRRLVLTGLTLDAGLSSVESFRHTIGRYIEAGVTDLVVHWPRTSDPYGGDIATFEHIFSA